MKMACFFGHKWDGCKCIKCGKFRDEYHDWDLCKGKCSKCDKACKQQHEWNGRICSKCGEIYKESIQDYINMLRKEFDLLEYNQWTRSDYPVNYDDWILQHRDVVKGIAESISRNYGFSGMQQVYRGYAEPLPGGLGDIKASILNSLWNGIGGWQW